MSNYPLPKDPYVAQYLEFLKERNIDRASKCQFCNNPSAGINSDGYLIIFVCKDHYKDE